MSFVPLGAILVALSLSVPAQTVLHVSPKGKDAWSGQTAEPNPAGNDGPKATLKAALETTRGLKRDSGITILLHDGMHWLSEPVQLGPADSGSSEKAPFVIAAAPGAKPILSGGRKLTGFKRSLQNPRLWELELPEVREGKWLFRQLWVNGQRKQRSRTPNDGFFRIAGESPQDKPVRIKAPSAQFKPEWAQLGDVEVVALLAWSDIRMQIRDVDVANSVAVLSGDPRPSNRENNARFYIENAPDALDAPGEWYLDHKTGLFKFWSDDEADLNQAEVIAPYLADLFMIKGDPVTVKPVQHVHLRGLSFSHTDWTIGDKGYADTQAAVATRGDVYLEYAVDCVIEDCNLRHLAGYGLDLAKGCKRIRVVGNEMSDLGGGGVRIGETSHPKDDFEACNSHQLTDNHIHHGGLVYPPAVGVFVIQSGSNRIAHNHIHHLYYTAVSVGWTWGYHESPCRENIVEFNHMHDIGQGMLSDMGAVYTLGLQPGSVVRNNLIHDVSSFTYGGWGLYTDEGSTGILLENNVVYRCKSAGFHQHYGRENTVRNNIFALNRENQLMRSRPEPHISFFFTNNIVYFDSGVLLGSNWSNDNYHMDRNLYWDTRLARNPVEMKFAGATLEEWRKRGHDQNSVIADPLFKGPETTDFSLQPGSPALALGFKPIDLRRVGIRPKAERP